MVRGLAIALALGVVLLAVPSAKTATRPKAPRVVGLSLEGKRINLATFRGKPVFINVWSSW
jgi:hypothetical protein